MSGHKKKVGRPSVVTFFSEERGLTALLILLFVEMFVIAPMTLNSQVLQVAGLLVFFLMLLSGLLAMARSRVFQMVSAVFVALAIIVRLARVVFDVRDLVEWDALLSILSIAGMVAVVLWQVYREGPVTGHRIRGAVAAYLLIAVIFGYVYAFIAYLVPGSFQLPAWASQPGPELVETFSYFSIVSLTTVGFGDIAAIHPLARSTVTLEALIGQLYPAILIARLVTLELEDRRSKKKGPGNAS